jgi:hypothetical protein
MEILMSIGRMALALAAMWSALAIPAAAQHPTVEMDSANAQLRVTLRAFYFNLAHRDWEALAAEILSAKIMASHPAPESLLAVAGRAAPAARPDDCSTEAAARVEQAIIALDGDWAEALVPHCPRAARDDEFRLVRFEQRWRIIYIDLPQGSAGVQLAR